MRGEVYNWIKLRIGNGDKARFWTDSWSPFGSLQRFLANDLNFSLGVPDEATVSSLFRHDHWLLPHPRSEKQLQLHVFLTTVALSPEEDHYEWEVEGKNSSLYSTGQVYNCLTTHGAVVPWENIIWITGGIPKHSFLCWLFILNRCPTRDRLLRWGLQTSPNCLLCNTSPESRDHLFFSCPFSWNLWSLLAIRAGLNPEQQWIRVTTQLQALNSRNWKGRLILLTWQCCIYWILQERNGRLHRNAFRSVDALLRMIDRQIRDRILSYRNNNPQLSSRMMQLWLA